jgi:hypothetical protein
MSANDFGKLALSLPETEERFHMSHPDFRVAGKIFATLSYPDKMRAMVKLSPGDQHNFSRDYPDAFIPVKGTWGRRGATSVDLKTAKKETVARAIRAAWHYMSPKTFAEQKGLIYRHDKSALELTQSLRAPKINMKPSCPSQPSHTHATLRIRMQEVRSPLRKNPEVL